MSYVYTVGLKVVVEEVLTALTETPTVYAYDFLTGDALTSPAPTITSVRTGVYRLSVTANMLTDVLFVFIPHQDDEDKIGQEALMHEKMYHVVDELANGVTLADGAITADKITTDTYNNIAYHVQKNMGDRFEVFISGKYPDIVVSGAGTVGIDGVYEYRYMRNGKPRYCLVLDGEDTEMQLLWDTHKWGIQFGEDYSGFYYSNSDVPTPDLATDWWGYAGDSPMPEVTTALDTSLYAQLETIRGAGWTDESLKAIAEAIDAIDGGLDAAGVRSAIGLASANLDTQLSGIKTDTNNVTTRLTATRAGYIDKLNVAGNLANTTNAGDFKADTTGLAKTTDLSGLALEATLTAMKGAGWTNETLVAILEAIDEIDPGGGGGGATPQQIWEYANRELSTPSNYKADLTTLESRLTANRAGYLDKLNVPGTLANTNNAGTFKADVSGIPAAVWGFATRTLSGFGTLVSDIWSFATRTLSAFGFTVATSSDANVTAIKAKTDNLPASPAAVGSAMILTSAYDKAKDDVLTPLGVIDGKADAIKLQTDKIPNTPAVTGEYTSALTAIQADLDNPGQYKADVSALAKVTDLSGLAEKTDIPSDYAKANDLSGLAKTTDITALNNLSAAEMLNEVVVGTFTLREILTILAAKSDGYPATGGGTTTITYGGIDGTPGVIVETVDEDGNRSKVEFNL